MKRMPLKQAKVNPIMTKEEAIQIVTDHCNGEGEDNAILAVAELIEKACDSSADLFIQYADDARDAAKEIASGDDEDDSRYEHGSAQDDVEGYTEMALEELENLWEDAAL